MTEEAQAAFDELVELGAEPIDWHQYTEGEEPHIAFGLSMEVKRCGVPQFVDYRAEHIVETEVDGEWQNSDGVRQDVHEILNKHGLEYDWYDHVILVVYNNQD